MLIIVILLVSAFLLLIIILILFMILFVSFFITMISQFRPESQRSMDFIIEQNYTIYIALKTQVEYNKYHLTQVRKRLKYYIVGQNQLNHIQYEDLQIKQIQFHMQKLFIKINGISNSGYFWKTNHVRRENNFKWHIIPLKHFEMIFTHTFKSRYRFSQMFHDRRPKSAVLLITKFQRQGDRMYTFISQMHLYSPVIFIRNYYRDLIFCCIIFCEHRLSVKTGVPICYGFIQIDNICFGTPQTSAL